MKSNNVPIAKKIKKEIVSHGIKRIDNYFWMRDRKDPKVLEYINKENEYTNKITDHIKPLETKLYNEIVARINEDDDSVPEKIDNYFYYIKFEKGKQYPVYYRRKFNETEEEVLLDQNILSKNEKYFKLGFFEISPDHNLLAYGVDNNGSEELTLFVKDLKTDKILKENISKLSYSFVWAKDCKTCFYTVLDNSKRPYKLFKHTLFEDHKFDELIYHEKDESVFIDVSKTSSGDYILLSLGNQISTEVRYLNSNNIKGNFKTIAKMEKGHEYFIEHHNNKFYILTNLNAKNFRLVETDISNCSIDNWKEIIPHNIKVKLDDIHMFKDHLVVHLRENGLQQIRIQDLNTNNVHYIKFDENVYSCNLAANREYNTENLRFYYESFTTPTSVYDYNMNTKEKNLKKVYEVLGAYDPKDYVSERLWTRSDDGTNVPVSIVYKKGLVKNGKNPVFLEGYGSYGYSFDVEFLSARISLLDRGFIYATAHIRGGSELGRLWYENGKFLKKKNTFKDFILCAEKLISEKYTSKGMITGYGASAGGLLMGAVTNMKPDIFNVIVAKVPFVDVINTLEDSSLPLTVIEYDEWGDPKDKEYFDYILSYSPYDNVEKKEYPNMLITGGLNDPRVQYWEPLKWTAKLRELKKDNNTLILKINMGAGHGGLSGRYEKYKEIAFEYAFILDMYNINN